MKLGDYIEGALSTAIYPDEYYKMYPLLGGNGEAGEVADKIKKVIRDNDSKWDFETRLKTVLENGDTAWYAAVDIDRFNLSVDREIEVCDIVPMKGDLYCLAIELNYYMGLFAHNYIHGIPADPNIIMSAFSCMAGISIHLGFSLEYTLTKNLEKLAARVKNHTINGSGDER